MQYTNVNETIGERIIEAARMAAAIHLCQRAARENVSQTAPPRVGVSSENPCLKHQRGDVAVDRL